MARPPGTPILPRSEPFRITPRAVGRVSVSPGRVSKPGNADERGEPSGVARALGASAGSVRKQPRHPSRCEGRGKSQTQRRARAVRYEDVLVEQRRDDAAGLALAGADNTRSVG